MNALSTLQAVRTQTRVALIAGRDMAHVRALADKAGCVSVFMGRHLVVYGPKSGARFCIALDGVCENGKQVGAIAQ